MMPEEIYHLKVRLSQLEAENKKLADKIIKITGSGKYGRPCGKEAWAIAHPILEASKMTREMFLGPNKRRDVVKARAEIYCALYDTGRWSLAAIGKMSGRHHATVHQQIRIYKERMK